MAATENTAGSDMEAFSAHLFDLNTALQRTSMLRMSRSNVASTGRTMKFEKQPKRTALVDA